MITEVTVLTCGPGKEAGLEVALKEARALFNRAKGCENVTFLHSITTSDCYLLIAEWRTLENHTVDFQQSDDFQAWRALITPHLVKLPEAEHYDNVL